MLAAPVCVSPGINPQPQAQQQQARQAPIASAHENGFDGTTTPRRRATTRAVVSSIPLPNNTTSPPTLGPSPSASLDSSRHAAIQRDLSDWTCAETSSTPRSNEGYIADDEASVTSVLPASVSEPLRSHLSLESTPQTDEGYVADNQASVSLALPTNLPEPLRSYLSLDRIAGSVGRVVENELIRLAAIETQWMTQELRRGLSEISDEAAAQLVRPEVEQRIREKMERYGMPLRADYPLGWVHGAVTWNHVVHAGAVPTGAMPIEPPGGFHFLCNLFPIKDASDLVKLFNDTKLIFKLPTTSGETHNWTLEASRNNRKLALTFSAIHNSNGVKPDEASATPNATGGHTGAFECRVGSWGATYVEHLPSGGTVYGSVLGYPFAGHDPYIAGALGGSTQFFKGSNFPVAGGVLAGAFFNASGSAHCDGLVTPATSVTPDEVNPPDAPSPDRFKIHMTNEGYCAGGLRLSAAGQAPLNVMPAISGAGYFVRAQTLDTNRQLPSEEARKTVAYPHAKPTLLQWATNLVSEKANAVYNYFAPSARLTSGLANPIDNLEIGDSISITNGTSKGGVGSAGAVVVQCGGGYEHKGTVNLSVSKTDSKKVQVSVTSLDSTKKSCNGTAPVAIAGYHDAERGSENTYTFEFDFEQDSAKDAYKELIINGTLPGATTKATSFTSPKDIAKAIEEIRRTPNVMPSGVSVLPEELSSEADIVRNTVIASGLPEFGPPNTYFSAFVGIRKEWEGLRTKTTYTDGEIPKMATAWIERTNSRSLLSAARQTTTVREYVYDPYGTQGAPHSAYEMSLSFESTHNNGSFQQLQQELRQQMNLPLNSSLLSTATRHADAGPRETTITWTPTAQEISELNRVCEQGPSGIQTSDQDQPSLTEEFRHFLSETQQHPNDKETLIRHYLHKTGIRGICELRGIIGSTDFASIGVQTQWEQDNVLLKDVDDLMVFHHQRPWGEHISPGSSVVHQNDQHVIDLDQLAPANQSYTPPPAAVERAVERFMNIWGFREKLLRALERVESYPMTPDKKNEQCSRIEKALVKLESMLPMPENTPETRALIEAAFTRLATSSVASPFSDPQTAAVLQPLLVAASAQRRPFAALIQDWKKIQAPERFRIRTEPVEP